MNPSFFPSTTSVSTASNRNSLPPIAYEISETSESSPRLELSEQKYRSAIENIPDVIWSTLPDGRFVTVSPNVEDVCGFTAGEVRSQHEKYPFSHVHPEDLECVLEAYEQLMAGEPMDVEYRRQHKNGRWHWIHNRATAVRDTRGVITRIDGILYDVTERRELSDKLRCVQKLEAIGQLAGGVAHDFNNILQVILATTEFMGEELVPGSAARSDVEEIKQAAQRAAALTRQLLAFSRQQTLAPIPLQPSNIVRGLEPMLRRLISENISMSIEAASDASVCVDPGQLEQVIINLCVNARDAMPNGGVLAIETSAVSRSVEESYVCISVRDDGTGIDDATRRRIFEPFFTTKCSGKGTGLGLSTCYGIVEQAGGFIEVDSAPGAGSTFRVCLPQIVAETDRPQDDREEATSFDGSETLLLVEDNEVLCKTIARALRARGYHVMTAHSGSEALTLAEQRVNAIDLVLSDVIVPDFSGFEIVELVQKRVPAAKAMLMSGHTDHALLEGRALSVGTTFIQKPFPLVDLAKKVRKTLDSRTAVACVG